jgi:hypothetical protein
LRHVFGEKIAEPHTGKVASAPPRSIGVSVEACNGNDANVCQISDKFVRHDDKSLLCPDGLTIRCRVELCKAQKLEVETDTVIIAYLHLPAAIRDTEVGVDGVRLVTTD